MNGSRRMMAALWAGVVLTLGCGASPADGCIGQQQADMTEVYARADWYLARPEPEEEWRGVLRERDAPIGPGTRSALIFELVSEDSTLSVYAGNAEDVLAPFVDVEVLVCGKLVDLSAEGFGLELWIGSIRKAEGREA